MLMNWGDMYVCMIRLHMYLIGVVLYIPYKYVQGPYYTVGYTCPCARFDDQLSEMIKFLFCAYHLTFYTYVYLCISLHINVCNFV